MVLQTITITESLGRVQTAGVFPQPPTAPPLETSPLFDDESDSEEDSSGEGSTSTQLTELVDKGIQVSRTLSPRQ